MKKTVILFVIGFMVIAFSFQSCEKEGNSDSLSQTEFHKKAQLTNVYENEIATLASDFTQQTTLLKDATKAYQANITSENLVTAQEQWKSVQTSVVASKWLESQPIILTKWVDNLDVVYIPPELKDDKRRLHPNYRFESRPMGELCELAQWSDLIVFDYISANLDRVVNNMFNLKWNYKMMDKPIHNLEKSTVTGSFMFLDNESGLFHGYRLLDTYGQYHESLLQAVCVFRKSTVNAVETLYKSGKTGEILQSLYENNEQYHGFLPRIPVKNRNILEKRIEHVYKHIQLCKNQYPQGMIQR